MNYQFAGRKISRFAGSILAVVGLSFALSLPSAAQQASGTKPAGTLCTGTPTADVAVNVTSQMSMVAPGVTVYQLTGLDKDGNVIVNEMGQPVPNYLTNVDVVNYTTLNPPSFIVNSGEGVHVKTIRIDHQGAQIASTLYGLHLRISQDGTMVAQGGLHSVQPGDKTTGGDIFVTNLAASGACTSTWVTNQHFDPASSSGASGIPLTNPSWDANKGAYLIAYAPGGANSSLPPAVYSVYSNGQASSYTPMEPVDNCKGMLYHKTRMSYTFPYIVFLQREDGNNGCGMMMDLRTGFTVEFGDGTGGTKTTPNTIFYNHDDQEQDGRSFLMNASEATGGIARTMILDENGNFIPGSNHPKNSGNLEGYQIINPTLKGSKTMIQAEWCDMAPNKKALCTSGSGHDTGGISGLPAGCYPVFAVDPASNGLRFLACSDGDKTGQYEGLAAVRFAYQDGNGLYHALFRSDKTGTPQTYEIVFKP